MTTEQRMFEMIDRHYKSYLNEQVQASIKDKPRKLSSTLTKTITHNLEKLCEQYIKDTTGQNWTVSFVIYPDKNSKYRKWEIVEGSATSNFNTVNVVLGNETITYNSNHVKAQTANSIYDCIELMKDILDDIWQKFVLSQRLSGTYFISETLIPFVREFLTTNYELYVAFSRANPIQAESIMADAHKTMAAKNSVLSAIIADCICAILDKYAVGPNIFVEVNAEMPIVFYQKVVPEETPMLLINYVVFNHKAWKKRLTYTWQNKTLIQASATGAIEGMPLVVYTIITNMLQEIGLLIDAEIRENNVQRQT